MKNKAPLSLIEQLCMLLVFALAAGLCLQIYVFSGQLSQRSAQRSEAAIAVQNTAEAVKYCRGDSSLYPAILGGSGEESCWRLNLDENWNEAAGKETCYYISVCPKDSGLPLLGKAEVSAFYEDGEEIFSLTVSWQEVAHE